MAVWIADRRLYLAADGITVVEEGDSRKASLLVPVGGTLPMERARDLGLLDEVTGNGTGKALPEITNPDEEREFGHETTPAADEPKGRPAPANKLKNQPSEDK